MIKLSRVFYFTALVCTFYGVHSASLSEDNVFLEVQKKIQQKISDAGDFISLEQQLSEQLESLKKQLARDRDSKLVLELDVPVTDAIAVVGGGLSGLTAALRLLESGASVILIEKREFMGGNSAYASSGINGGKTEQQTSLGVDDSPDQFYDDTMKSSQRSKDSFTGKLARRMADDSKSAVQWISERANVSLPDVGQLGGHSAPRTHRPRSGLAGAAFISGLEKAVMKYEKLGQLLLLRGSRLENMIPFDPSCAEEADTCSTSKPAPWWGLVLRQERKGQTVVVKVPGVILATGGFANDKGPGSLLSKVAPGLEVLGSTNGNFATGDGIKVGMSVGAKTVDLDMVQVHPTGFSDAPKGFVDEGPARSLVLCAEIIRGEGGVILDKNGERFVDELDTRKKVTAAMKERGRGGGARGYGKFVIAIPPQAAAKVAAHIQIYTGKDLLHPVDGYKGVRDFIEARLSDQGGGKRPPKLGTQTKRTFEEMTGNRTNVKRRKYVKLPLEGTYYVGVIEPVLHYTMGGLAVNPDGQVLDDDEVPIAGLLASGEIMGGVHGINRLGGSSLLDCVVFGLSAAKTAMKLVTKSALPLLGVEGIAHVIRNDGKVPASRSSGKESNQKIVKVKGRVFDLTDFIPTHPGGPIVVKDNEDLTERFVHAHGNDMDLFDRDSIREIRSDGTTVKREKKFFEEYGSQGGSWREFIGRRAWFVLHSFAAKYPEYPSDDDKSAMTNLFAAFGQLYPCKLCRKHLQQQLREPFLGPPRVESRQALSKWVCELHNIVNADIGKPQVPCNPFQIDLMYLKDCGECEVTPPPDDEGNPVAVDETTKSGYHPTTGPWDAEIYRRDQILLESVKDSADAWETKDLAELVDAMDTLRKWFRTFSKSELKTLRKDIRQGPKVRSRWIKEIQGVFRPALKSIKKNTIKAIHQTIAEKEQ